MFREQYRQLNKQVNPNNNLIQETIYKAEKYGRKVDSKVYVFRKPIIALVSMCLCISLGMPALAASVEPIYQLMYMVSPSVAQFFMPVQKADEDNGIKMEVISAYIHDNVAEIYITMQDLTQNRMDETTDLFDSYNINRPFDSLAHCECVGYDENTKTATFLITIEESGGKNITGDKITFTVREFLSHKKTYEDMTIPIDLSVAEIAKSTQIVSSTGGGGVDYSKYIGLDIEIDPTALIPAEPMREFAVDGIDLTGIGYIDGKLHIQTAVKDNLEKDNHGFFYLKDSNGNQVECNYNFYFVNQDEGGRIDYCNYVFDIPKNQLANYTLHGDFVTSGMKTEGKWSVTFPLEQVDLRRK